VTDEEMEEICVGLFETSYLPQNFKLFGRAVEAEFKQKNTLE
jgi:hypothetical protein